MWSNPKAEGRASVSKGTGVRDWLDVYLVEISASAQERRVDTRLSVL